MPSTHKKDKPWDTEDIDKWKESGFTPTDNAAGTFTEESSFGPSCTYNDSNAIVDSGR